LTYIKQNSKITLRNEVKIKNNLMKKEIYVLWFYDNKVREWVLYNCYKNELTAIKEQKRNIYDLGKTIITKAVLIYD
jgi:hypothetical protein